MKKSYLLNLALAVVIIVLVYQNVNLGNKPVVAQKSEAVVDTVHQKKSIGKKGAMFPQPAMVIGSYNSEGVPNIMTAAWIGIANSKPTKISVSMRPATLSYHNLTEHKAFTINVPSAALAKYVDYVGKYSGKDMNKFEKLGLTAVKGDSVYAPYVKEFPIVIECKITEMHDLGSHRQFIGQVVDTKVDLSILNEKGHIDMHKLDPIILGAGGYFTIGDFIGKPGEVYKLAEEEEL